MREERFGDDTYLPCRAREDHSQMHWSKSPQRPSQTSGNSSYCRLRWDWPERVCVVRPLLLRGADLLPALAPITVIQNPFALVTKRKGDDI